MGIAWKCFFGNWIWRRSIRKSISVFIDIRTKHGSDPNGNVRKWSRFFYQPSTPPEPQEKFKINVTHREQFLGIHRKDFRNQTVIYEGWGVGFLRWSNIKQSAWLWFTEIDKRTCDQFRTALRSDWQIGITNIDRWVIIIKHTGSRENRLPWWS